METKKDLKKNKYNQSILSSNNLCDLILQGKNINNLIVDRDDDILLYEKYKDELLKKDFKFIESVDETLSVEEFYSKLADDWTLPESYRNIDVKEWLINKCVSQNQIDRINKEYKLFEQKNLIMVLRLFIFLVDYMRSNNFIWGVGRGSSVNSYILYVIGVHKVDSIFYSLSIEDFLK
jgi:DNA polymerase III alpha subunit